MVRKEARRELLKPRIVLWLRRGARGASVMGFGSSAVCWTAVSGATDFRSNVFQALKDQGPLPIQMAGQTGCLMNSGFMVFNFPWLGFAVLGWKLGVQIPPPNRMS
ncbi:hypothetical protein [Nisaea sp.]|uniref:hypothetical protein n=1 Tax=Nisaea sp. TaxID=2024842 RepID=UPI003B52B30A